jgi:hypothetical protein
MASFIAMAAAYRSCRSCVLPGGQQPLLRCADAASAAPTRVIE